VASPDGTPADSAMQWPGTELTRSDLFTDVSYILAVPSLTTLGWILLVPPPFLNLVGVVIMAANVWFVIWPAQQKVLGLKPAEDAEKAAAAKLGLLASRTNVLLSIPMLLCMTNFH